MKKTAMGLVGMLLLCLWTPSPARPQAESRVDDQVAVEVTVYNNDLGLIKDVRRVSLPVGQGTVRFMDVAAHILPETVAVRSLDDAGAFAVLEQNYEYDLMSADRLLDKFVGKKIRIVDINPEKDRRSVVEAVLLSNNQGQVYEIDGEIYLGHPGYRVLPQIPGDLMARPTLTWQYRNQRETPHRIEVSYLTRNIGWRADYVLVLDAQDSAGDLSGWVTLDNQSGAAYTDARLKLVAGDVNRVTEPPAGRMMALETAKADATPPFRQQSLFEYHIYDLERKTTIGQRQTKQIRLLEAAGVAVEKELRVAGDRNGLAGKRPGRSAVQPAAVFVHLKNTRAAGLGTPLPAGIMRFYKADADGSLQFVGEDRIRHTPADETVTLKIGDAFDVTAERVQTDYRRLTPEQHESAWEITLSNRKSEPVRVGVVEPMWGTWLVVEKSHAYRKEDAFTIRFDVDVPEKGTVKVTYRVRVGG